MLKRDYSKSYKVESSNIFCHTIRQNDALQRSVLDGKVNGKRGRSRPRMKWTSNVEKWTGMKYHQAVRQTHDRDK